MRLPEHCLFSPLWALGWCSGSLQLLHLPPPPHLHPPRWPKHRWGWNRLCGPYCCSISSSSRSSSSGRLQGVWTEGGGCDGTSDDDLEKITDEVQFCIFTFMAFNIYHGSRVVTLENYIFKLSNKGIN